MIRSILAGLYVIALAVPVAAQEERSWHLMTQSYGGTVSLLKDLTEHECQFARARALKFPATKEENIARLQSYKLTHPECPQENRDHAIPADDWKKWHAEHPYALGCAFENGGMSWGGGTMSSNGDIKSAECFQ